MSLLLPLYSTTLHDLGTDQHTYLSYIEQAVELVIDRQRRTDSERDVNGIKNLIVSVSCDEIEQYRDCVDKIWGKIQSVLGRLYVKQLQTAYAQKEPLFDCHIVFEDLCGYKVEEEPYIKAIIIPSSETVQGIRKVKSSTEHSFEEIKMAPAGNKRDEEQPVTSQKQSSGFSIQHLLHEDDVNDDPCHFNRVAVGGTFDHLHAGHKILLTMTAILAQQSMVVGVTDDCMLQKKKHRELIASTMQRVQNVKNYLQTIVKRNIKYDVVPIKDPFGPTVTDPTIDALVVSKETLKGGDLVNNERDMRGLGPLSLRIIDVISTSEASIDQKEDIDILKISSSWIREYIATTTAAAAPRPTTATLTDAASPATTITDQTDRATATATPNSSKTEPVTSSRQL